MGFDLPPLRLSDLMGHDLDQELANEVEAWDPSDIAGRYGASVLTWAARHRLGKLVNALVERGAIPTAEAEWDLALSWAELHGSSRRALWACGFGNRAEGSSLLLEVLALEDLNNGLPLLQEGMRLRPGEFPRLCDRIFNPWPIEFALRYGEADPNEMYEGDRPIHLAARQSADRVLSVLFRYGADPMLPDRDGRTMEDYLTFIDDEWVVREILIGLGRPTQEMGKYPFSW